MALDLPQPIERVDGRVTLSFRAIGAERGRVVIADLGGRVVHRDRWEGLDGLIDRTWDLKTDRGERVPPGLYGATAIVRDAAGNVSTSETRPLRDEHPVTARVVTSVQGAHGLVALTFDDCVSHSAWARILTVLEASNAKATFFCSGPRVAAAPALARRTVREGNGVGSHGWDQRPARSVSSRSAIAFRVTRPSGGARPARWRCPSSGRLTERSTPIRARPPARSATRGSRCGASTRGLGASRRKRDRFEGARARLRRLDRCAPRERPDRRGPSGDPAGPACPGSSLDHAVSSS